MARAIDNIVGAFDPAQSYETSNNEACGNLYRKLIVPDPADANKLVGDLAESWQVSKDGLVFTFQLRRGVKFDNGNELTAEDAAFSLQRVVKLNKTPGFILTQFGWNADNVEQMIRATADHTLELTLPVLQAPTFVLYCLSATVGCVVEKARVLANQANNDLGNEWLKTHSAGAGSYRLVEWQASDHIILEANPHAAVKPRIPRVVIRHVAEPASQLLLLQKGDADIAGNLNADQLKGIAKNPDFGITKIDQLNSLYLGLNASLPQFQKIEVRQAIKWAIDYDAIADNITPNVWGVWQTFLPKGAPGSIPGSAVQEGCGESQGTACRGRLSGRVRCRPGLLLPLAVCGDRRGDPARPRGGRHQGAVAGRRDEAGHHEDARAPAPDDTDDLVPRLSRSEFQRPGVQRQPRRFR